MNMQEMITELLKSFNYKIDIEVIGHIDPFKTEKIIIKSNLINDEALNIISNIVPIRYEVLYVQDENINEAKVNVRYE